MDTELDDRILDAIRHFGEATTGQIAAWIKIPTEYTATNLDELLRAGRVDLTRDCWTVALPRAPEWRCTLPRRYPTETAVADREGHYIAAATAEEAAEIMAQRFPGERIAVQSWKDGERRPLGGALVLTRAMDGAYYSYATAKITRAEALALPVGTPVSGLAPIGIRWSATVARRADGSRYFRPAAGCPVGEFAPTGARVNGVYKEIA